MFKLDQHKDEYYDFKLTNDCRVYNRNYQSFRIINVEFLESLRSFGTPQSTEDVTLSHLPLVGYDNYYIRGDDYPIPNIDGVRTLSEGRRFRFSQVSGYTLDLNILNADPQYINEFRGIQIPHEFYHNNFGKSSGYTYDIFNDSSGGVDYKKLNGGFYQGFFKIHGYPFELSKTRMRKGWTVNELLYTRTSQVLPEIIADPDAIDWYTFYFNFKPLEQSYVGLNYKICLAEINSSGVVVMSDIIGSFDITEPMLTDNSLFLNTVIDNTFFSLTGNTVFLKTDFVPDNYYFYDSLGILEYDHTPTVTTPTYLGYTEGTYSGVTTYEVIFDFYNINDFNGEVIELSTVTLNENNLPIGSVSTYTSPPIDDNNVLAIMGDIASAISGEILPFTYYVAKTVTTLEETRNVFKTNLNFFFNNVRVKDNVPSLVDYVFEPALANLYPYHILNTDYPNNEGIIFYMGTRAENKFQELTLDEITGITRDTDIEFINMTGLATDNTGFYTSDGLPYNGYYNITSGRTYTGSKFNDGSRLLTKHKPFYDIIDNAFGVFIYPDGRVGYRAIFKTDPCFTGQTLDPYEISTSSFDPETDPCTTNLINRIYTTGFTVEDVRSNEPMIDLEDDKFVFITVVFERHFSYDGCVLEDYKYGPYRLGVLKIYANGFKIFEHNNCPEVIPHELDVDFKYQEGVPFQISAGGGINNLLEVINYDIDKPQNTILEKFFAGSFMGGIVTFEMYATPLYLHEIKVQRDLYTTQYNLFTVNGGRTINYKQLF